MYADLCPRGYKAYASKEHDTLLAKRNQPLSDRQNAKIGSGQASAAPSSACSGCSSSIMVSPRRVTWDLNATKPVHAGGDGLQHQAGHGCPHRDDGNGRITPSNVPKTADNSRDFIKNGGLTTLVVRCD